MYNKKFYLSVALLICACVCSHAQYYDIGYSLNWNKMTNIESGAIFSPLNFNLNFGWAAIVFDEDDEIAGGDIEDRFEAFVETNRPSLWLVSGIQFQSKRVCIEQNEKLNINYLNIPLMLTYRTPVLKLQDINALFVDLSVGGYGGYAVRGRSTLNGEKYNILSDVGSRQYNRFDAGLRFSIGLSDPLFGILSFEYEYGLVDIIKNNHLKKVHNRTLFLNFNLLFLSRLLLNLSTPH